MFAFAQTASRAAFKLNQVKRKGKSRGPGSGRALNRDDAIYYRRRHVFTPPCHGKRRNKMLWTIAVVLLVLWVLGLVSSYTLGGFIHVLLAVALIVFLIQVVQGRRV